MDEVASRLAVRRASVYRLIREGEVAAVRVGRLWRVRSQSLASFIACGGSARWTRSRHHPEQRETVLRPALRSSQKRNPEPSSTKTGRERTVDLSAELVAVLDTLRAQRNRQALARNWHPVPPWVFVTANGTPYSERNVTHDFKRVLARAWPKPHLPGCAAQTVRARRRCTCPEPAEWHFSVQSLRHSFATLHLLNGEDVQWVHQQLGHRSIQLTVDTYGSWITRSATRLPRTVSPRPSPAAECQRRPVRRQIPLRLRDL